CYLDRHLHVRTLSFYCSLFFSFTDTATTEIYTLSLTTLFRSLYGASSLANMASRRSGEYFMGTFSLPLVGDSNSNICRGSNYSDSGGTFLPTKSQACSINASLENCRTWAGVGNSSMNLSHHSIRVVCQYRCISGK